MTATPRGILLADASVGVPDMVNTVIYTNPLDGSKRYRREPGTRVASCQFPVFVYGVTGVADGDKYSGRVCPAPVYFYNAPSGGSKSARGYAISTDLAKSLPKASE